MLAGGLQVCECGVSSTRRGPGSRAGEQCPSHSRSRQWETAPVSPTRGHTRLFLLNPRQPSSACTRSGKASGVERRHPCPARGPGWECIRGHWPSTASGDDNVRKAECGL